MPNESACKFGYSFGTCAKMSEVLAPDMELKCNGCQLVGHTKQVLRTAHDTQNPEAILKAQRLLTLQGKDPQEIEKVTPHNISAFQCSTLKTPVVSPCQLKDCPYNIDYSSAQNCMQVYMHQQNIDELSVEDIAILLSRNYQEVSEIFNLAMQKLRKKIPQESEEIKQEFKFLPTRKVCCVCESAIREKSPKLSCGLSYCSDTCKSAKPAKTIKLENQYGVHIQQLLEWALIKFATIAAIEEVFDLNRNTLREYVHKFLYSRLDDYFPALKDLAVDRENRLSKRSRHTNEKEMAQFCKRAYLHIEKQFGKCKTQRKYLEDELAAALAT